MAASRALRTQRACEKLAFALLVAAALLNGEYRARLKRTEKKNLCSWLTVRDRAGGPFGWRRVWEGGREGGGGSLFEWSWS